MDPKIFSQSEKEVLKILSDKTLTTSQIAEKFAKDHKILDPNNSVTSVINRINKKCRFHKLQWFINGAGIGRNGKSVWIDDV
jgi:hypothetical protein